MRFLSTLTTRFRAPLQFAAAGLLVSAVSDSASLRTQLQHAEAARRLHDGILGFPVWPFHVGPDVLLLLVESFLAAAIAHVFVTVLLHPK
jgi:hypothetical protein